MSATVMVGIPTYNEAGTIGNVVRAVDEGLHRDLQDLPAVIVNADNNSSDGTREAFLGVRTRAAKYSVTTAPGIRGKGYNVAALLQAAAADGVGSLVLVDGDVRSIGPGWVPTLLEPILEDAAGLVLPAYDTSQGGPLTKLLCRPVIWGLFSADLPQPIGGEMALSAGLIGELGAEALPDHALGYGIDTFLTTEAVMREVRLAIVRLGRKEHRLRPWHTISPIVAEVAGSLHHQLHRHRAALARRRRTLHPKVRGPALPSSPPVSVPVADRIRMAAQATLPTEAELALLTGRSRVPSALIGAAEEVRQGNDIPGRCWAELLASWLARPDGGTLAGPLLPPLFLARMATWVGERAQPGYTGDEAMVAEVAGHLRRSRPAILDL